MSSLSVYKIHICKKAPPIPLLPFPYHFTGFSELRTERQNRKPVAIAKAPIGNIFVYVLNLYTTQCKFGSRKHFWQDRSVKN